MLCALATGVMILLGRYLGERRNGEISELIGNAVAFFSAMAVGLTVILILFARPIAVLMQAPQETVELTAQYIRICGAGFIFVVFYNLFSFMGYFNGIRIQRWIWSRFYLFADAGINNSVIKF